MNWNDGSPIDTFLPGTAQFTHTYDTLASFTVSVFAYGSNGCVGLQQYTIINDNEPVIGMFVIDSLSGCSPHSITFHIPSPAEGPTPNTVIIWEYGDGVIESWDLQDYLNHLDSNGLISNTHIYDTTSCGNSFIVGSNTYDNAFLASVTFTNACGSSGGGAIFPIEICEDPIVDFSNPPSGCGGAPIAFVNTTPPNGCAPQQSCFSPPNDYQNFIWIWGDGSPNDTTSSATTELHSFPGPADGCEDTIFQVTLIGSNSCGSDTARHFIQLFDQPTADIELTFDPTTLCQLNTVTTVNHCGNPIFTHTWNLNGIPLPPAPPVPPIVQTSALPEPVFPGLVAANYTLNYSVQNGCGADDTIINFTIKAAPLVLIDFSPICQDTGSAPFPVTPTIISIFDGGGTMTYDWQFPGATPSSSTLPIPTVNYNTTGCHPVQLTVTNECGSTVVYDTVCIQDNPGVSFSFDTVCLGDSTHLYDQSIPLPNGGNFTTWLWVFPNGDSILGQNAVYLFDTSGAHLVSLLVIDENGCSKTVIIPVIVWELPVPTVFDREICFGETSLPIGGTATSGTPPYSYNWSPSASLSCSNCSNPTASPLATTTYYVTVTDINGCVNQDSLVVTVDDSMYADALPDSSFLCYGQSVNLTGTGGGGNGGYTYLWSPATGLSCTTCPNPVATPLDTIIYTFSIFDTFQNSSSQLCSATDQIEVVVNPEIILNLGPDTLICFGDSIQLPTIFSGGTGPYTYSWSPTTAVSDPTILNPWFSPTASATYTLTISDSFNCQISDVINILVNPELTVNAGTDRTVCLGSSTALNAFPSGGTAPFAYLWSPAAGLSATNISNPVATPGATTSYSVIVTDANGCSATDTVIVNVE